MKYREQICEVLEDMGIYISDDEVEDFSLQTYILDSIQFISLIVNLEDKIGFAFPDELLQYDSIGSVSNLSQIIESSISSSSTNDNGA